MPSPTPTSDPTILLAVDVDDLGARAVVVAVRMAIQTRAALVLLTVLPVRDETELMGLDAQHVEDEKARVAIERIAAQAREQGANARALVVRSPTPAEGIVAAAQEVSAFVVVVSRHGRGDLLRAMLGDVTARVIGGAGIPVLVVPRTAELFQRRILLASDGSRASEAAARTAAAFSRFSGLPITVLSVEVPTHTAERQAEARRIVARTVAALQREGIDATGQVGAGAPADVILETANTAGADLIVLGSEGRTGIGRVVLGGNCQAVIRRTTCPVLVTTARMAEMRATVQPAPAQKDSSRDDDPSRRTYLLVVDDTEELQAALDYACKRALATGSRVALLRVTSSTGSATPTGAQGDLHDGHETTSVLDDAAARVQRLLGEPPQTYLRAGDPSRQLLDLLASERNITALVLASSPDPRGPGPLIIDLVTRHAAELPVPLVIVPGSPPGSKP